MRPGGFIAAALALALSACAASPEPGPGACAALDAVLGPLAAAARDSGLQVEIARRPDLRPPARETDQWRAIRSFGFAPVWRDPATDDALRSAYWRAWREIGQDMKRDDPAGADRAAWEAAYAELGDDRLYAEDSIWEAYFARNRRSGAWSCAARFADAEGARLVDAATARAPGAVRFIPARPGLTPDRALISAWSIYPPLNDGLERETGTIWLLSPSGEDWRVISARRLDGVGRR